MKVFVLNMKRSTERMARVKARLEALGVPFTRIEAIDDSQMSAEEKRTSVSRFGWWCCSLRPIMRGQVGCTLSHQKAYRTMIAEGLPHCCVLEDDVILDDRFPEVLAKLDAAIDDTRSQVVLMCDHSSSYEAGTQKPFGFERVDDAMFAEGYVLTKLAAEQILEDNYPLRVMDDIWGRWVRQGRIELSLARPTVCSQTSTQDGRTTIEFVGFER